jgi:diguanylate cyclase (GGDEF)-like protein
MQTIDIIARPFNRLSKGTIFILGWCFVLLFGGIGLLTEHQIVFGVFYLLPVSVASWYGSRRQGVIVSIASVLMQFADDLFSLHKPIGSFLLYWDAFGRLLPFLIIAYVFPALKNALQMEREFSRTDPLTGIANKRGFSERALREIERARRYKHEFTVSYMDIDNFKMINDSLGHAAGDSLLIAAAKTISKSVRAIDVAARIGGDEFVIMLPKTGYAEAEVIIRRIRDNLTGQMNKNHWNVTFSMGMITYRRFHGDIDSLIEETDALMYRVKSGGKDGIIHETAK